MKWSLSNKFQEKVSMNHQF